MDVCSLKEGAHKLGMHIGSARGRRVSFQAVLSEQEGDSSRTGGGLEDLNRTHPGPGALQGVRTAAALKTGPAAHRGTILLARLVVVRYLVVIILLRLLSQPCVTTHGRRGYIKVYRIKKEREEK